MKCAEAVTAKMPKAKRVLTAGIFEVVGGDNDDTRHLDWAIYTPECVSVCRAGGLSVEATMLGRPS